MTEGQGKTRTRWKGKQTLQEETNNRPNNNCRSNNNKNSNSDHAMFSGEQSDGYWHLFQVNHDEASPHVHRILDA